MVQRARGAKCSREIETRRRRALNVEKYERVAGLRRLEGAISVSRSGDSVSTYQTATARL